MTLNGGALVVELTVVLLQWQTVVASRRGRKEKKSAQADDGDNHDG